MSAAASISVMVIFPAPSGACARGLPRFNRSLPAARHVVVTSPDGMLARLAVPEVEGLTDAAVHVLDGGTDGVARIRQATVRDKTTPPDEACIDFYLRPYDRNFGIEEAMNAYLSWEIDLVHEIERDGTVAFGLPGETHAAA